MSSVAAFFDLDGTLVTGHIYGGLVKRRMTHPSGALRSIGYIVSHLALVPLHKVGLMESGSYYTRWGVDLAALVKGMRREQVARLFEKSAEELLLTVRPDVLKALQQHRSQGRVTMLVSGAFRELLEQVARKLEIPYAVGTRLEQRNGRYTGRVEGPFCFGEAKARLLKEFLKEAGLDVDMTASSAYGDRVYDIPFLGLVGNPVAVYPDEGLLTHAKEKGWQVVGQ